MPGKNVSQKLLIKDGYKVLLIDPPKGYLTARRGEFPGAKISESKKGEADLIQVVVASDAELKKKVPGLKERLKPKGLLWATYPKGASKLKSDIHRDTIREYAETIGLEAVSIVAVDEDWSALRLKPV